MNKSEKKVITIIALVIVVCIAAVTAVAFANRQNGMVQKNESFNGTVQSSTIAGGALSTTASNTAGSDTTVASQQSASSAGGVSSSAAQQVAAQITIDQAKSIALNDSKADQNAVVFEKQKLDFEHGVYEYEIEFHDSATEYEYEINAQTGDIISRSSEPYDFH